MIELTVVIATYNRAAQLRRALERLAVQTASPGCFEVVVVDDGSSDGTQAMLSAYASPYQLRVERQSNSGPSAARNRGLAAARGEFCLFLDDDILVDPEIVAEHLRVQKDEDGVLGLGALRVSLTSRGGLAHFFADWWDEHYRRFDSGERVPDFWACYSGNLSAPTAALRAIGGYDENLQRAEDVELGYRLDQSGLSMMYVKGGGGEQVYDKGFRDIVRDFDRAGIAAPAMWRKHPELLSFAPLGDFAQGTTKAVLARRVLLALRAPVWPLALLDPLLERRPAPQVYRFLQLYCFWRSLRTALDDRGTWRRLTQGTVILTYQAIGRRGEPATRQVTPAARFRRQLAWIRLTRRPVLSLDDYVRHRQHGCLPPARSVVLTFDGSGTDIVDVAQPILNRSGLRATVFLVVRAIRGGPLPEPRSAAGPRPAMSWDSVRQLQAAGLDIGCHSIIHRSLHTSDEEPAGPEVCASGRQIAHELGYAPRHFSYSPGPITTAEVEQIRGAGFHSGCDGEPGANGPAVSRYALRRLEVWGDRRSIRFALDLWLGRHLGSPEEGAWHRRRPRGVRR